LYPVHDLLLSCAHLARERPPGSRADPGIGAIARGRELRLWLDIALLLKSSSGRLDWEETVSTATAWCMRPALGVALVGVRQLFDMALPEDVLARLAASGDASPAGGCAAAEKGRRVPVRLRGSFSFERARMQGAIRYLFPPADFFGAGGAVKRVAQRAGHFVCGVLRLGTYMTDAACCWLLDWRHRHHAGGLRTPGRRS
jgi:hypothetical protein